MPIKRHGVTFMTVSELAKKLDIHRNTVIYWITSGQIEAARAGIAKKSPYIIPIEEAERIISELKEGDL